MPLNTLSNQAIALAGIAQVAALVQQLAETGKADSEAMQASIGSVLKIDADSVGDVYGGLAGVRLGLQQLRVQLTGRAIANPQQARYAASLVFLEKQLAERPELQNTIRANVERAQAQAEHFGLLHENVLANLAETYHQTISTLQPRIMVNGDPEILSRQEVVNKIRALLLAGIRSALLWRQCGGSRWKFLFYRKKLQAEIQQLCAQLETEVPIP